MHYRNNFRPLKYLYSISHFKTSFSSRRISLRVSLIVFDSFLLTCQLIGLFSSFHLTYHIVLIMNGCLNYLLLNLLKFLSFLMFLFLIIPDYLFFLVSLSL